MSKALVRLQFVCKQRHEKSVQEAAGEEQHGAGDRAERQEGSKHVEEKQQQYGPVAGQRAKAQLRPLAPLQHVPRHRAVLQFGAGIEIRQVVTTQTAQEVRTRAQCTHVSSKL